MTDLLWVVVPSGQKASNALLRVVIVPRLDAGETTSSNGLAQWPPPKFDQAQLTIDVAPRPDATPSSTIAMPRIEAQDGLWQEFFGRGSSSKARSRSVSRQAKNVAVAPTTQHAQDIESTYRAAADTLSQPDDINTFHETVRDQLRTFSPAADAPPVVAPARAMEPPDFNQVVGMLREHPSVLWALGLIIEVELPLDALGASTSGVVRVRWEGPIAGLPAITSPWSGYVRSGFRPLPDDDSDIDSGMLALGQDHWRLHTIDVDSALGRLRDASAAGSDTLPALRTAGVVLARAQRQLRPVTTTATDDSKPLTAERLLLGYRVDVREFGDEGSWHSLCKRISTYAVNSSTIAEELKEEGHVKARAGVDRGDNIVRADEAIARWDGWSLAAPRPNFDGERARNPRQADLPFDFHWDIRPEPATLLKLRYGTTYQLRARVADIAGGGRELGEASPDGSDSSSVVFARHEPIGSPVLRLPDDVDAGDLGPGGSVFTLVVRSGDGAFENTEDQTRLIEPPVSALDVVERHGRLDGAHDETFPLLQRAATGELPDPAATGVVAFLRPEPAGPVADVEAKKWRAWPDPGTKELHLHIREQGDPTLNWDTNEQLVVRLGPSEQVTLELSSFLSNDLLSEFALNNWLPRSIADDEPLSSATEMVLTGRHPMITPAKAVVLVHAVRKPLTTPSGSLNTARNEAQTFVDLEADAVPDDPELAPLNIHTPSTVTVRVTASWTEFDDNGEHAVEDAPVQSLPIDRGTKQLPPLRHELGDTKHRNVTYTLAAVGRFREYFEEASSDEFEMVGHSDEANVLSSARPIAPVVRSAVPAFTWEEERDGAVLTRRRLGNRVRIELARPWFTTGEGESLAVIVPDADSSPESLPFVSQMGRDPIWVTSDPPQFPLLDGDVVKLSENGAAVQAVARSVWRHSDSWYADVFVPETGSYSALVRFAVARYQPDSLTNLELSPVVHTDWVPLLPDRTLTVDMSERAQGTVTVTLSGTVAEGPTINRVDVIIEQNTDPSVVTDLVARDDSSDVPAWQVISEFQGAIDELITVEGIPLDGVLRLRVREVETIASGGSADDAELAERTVYTDIIAL